jgi:hypothetical protein
VITEQRLRQAVGLGRDLTGELLGLGQLHDEAVQYLYVFRHRRPEYQSRTFAGRAIADVAHEASCPPL